MNAEGICFHMFITGIRYVKIIKNYAATAVYEIYGSQT
jgi:hypothetical protein